MSSTMKVNEEMIEKTLTTAGFVNGGQLNNKQQDTLVKYVRKFSDLLPLVRFVRMTQSVQEVDKMHVGEPITEAVGEDDPTGTPRQPKFNKVTMVAKKLKSSWNMTTESLQENIEGDDLEDAIMMAFSQRVSTDLELLGIMGDDTITGTTPTDLLLKRNDGWRKLAEGSHVLDAGGSEISRGLLAAAKRMLPKQFRKDPALRWLLSDTIMEDYSDILFTRETALGDRAATENVIARRAISTPFVPIPLIPDDEPLTVGSGEATPGWHMGDQQGPFVIETGVNDLINIDVDQAGAATEIALPEGTFLPVELANYIKANIAGVDVYDNGMGFLVITSLTTGTTSEIDIIATSTPAQNAYGILGWTIGTYTGAAGSGTAPDGSFIILSNPKNLMFGMLDGTRIYSEFNKDRDRIEVVMYNQVACQIENLDAVVLVKNVRRRQLF